MKSISTDMLTVGEAARLAGVGPQRIRDLDARFKPVRAFGQRFYERAVIEEYAAERAARKAG